MLIIPAIDLKDGKCVRLKQGRMEDDTVFSDDPVGMATHWVEQGARRLHLVDLNGAFAGTPRFTAKSSPPLRKNIHNCPSRSVAASARWKPSRPM
jgi:phosphoribosylformimino-5-aminoimidazole carboxamide ribonucleotide (ProFAR) isomerase